MLDRLEFLLMEALTAIRRNFLMSLAAISTAAVALFLLGGLGYVYLRVNQAASDVSGKFEMRVWLKKDENGESIKAIAKHLRQINGVKAAFWVPKDIEWAKMKKDMPDLHLEGIQNPLNHSFKVILEELKDAPGVARQLEQVDGVDRVVYLQDYQEFVDRILKIVNWLGGVLGAILLATSAILIYNAIRLTILARRREVRIMQLVGATNLTIQTPFIIEGILHGMVGGYVAALLIMAGQAVIERQVREIVVGSSFAPFPIMQAMLWLGLAGAIFGGICSFWAIREPLKYRAGGGG